MEIKKQKCTTKEHEEIDASSYCAICKIFICNKCEVLHSKLFSSHITTILAKNNQEIFTGFCMEEKHNIELEYFCKTHNQLCCAACLCKLKKNENGKHKVCDVCFIEDIKDEKKNKIKENIKYLKELSNKLQNSINNLKQFVEKINENKEELKLKIQKIFTQIRNALNNREDELLLEVDKTFDNIYFKEEIIKVGENLPNKIKASVEESELLDKEYKENKLSLFINNCLNIENNIKKIKNIEESIKKCNDSVNIKLNFYPEDEKKINEFLDVIKNFGKINKNSLSDSSILNKDLNKENAIIKWIKQKISKDLNTFEKIFRMSENGFKSQDFHKYCDNKGTTLTLIKTTKNKIFGGFTPLNWDIKGKCPKDESNQTFIFSLDLMKKYDIIKKNEPAIRNSSMYGPIFGNYDFSLNGNMKKGETYANSACNFLSNENLELTGGKGNNETFEVEEFEIYKVKY